ncbi:MAG: hypothetical protein HZA52_04925 [Planctomycetes bacterium]|nr:hypothetical protein [Planctomycetota bacterium]
MARPAAESGERVSNVRRALAFVGGALLAYCVLLAFPLDPRDPTDEHEWTAISIAHFGQVFDGRTPPGALPGESEWRAGVQETTFGATNPCFAKLVLGGVLWARGFRGVEPEVFQRFAKDAPAKAALARARIEPALEPARAVVRATAALCAGLLALIALEVGGALAAALAWAGFAFAPLVRTWGGFVRTDFFMLAAALAVVAAALVLREGLGGERRLARKLAAAALVGALAGVATSAKFNGAPSALVAGAALVLAHLAAARGARKGNELAGAREPSGARETSGVHSVAGENSVADERAITGVRQIAGEHEIAGVRESSGALALLGALAIAGLACLGVVWLANPVLHAHPIDEMSSILAFWDEHMRYQQGRAAAQGLATPDGPLASLAFAARRLVTRDEPVVALTGLAWGWPVALAGLAVLAARARSSLAASVALAWAVLFGGVTAAWIPLDWDRYFLPLAALYALLEAVAVAALVGLCARAFRRPRGCRMPDTVRNPRAAG